MPDPIFNKRGSKVYHANEHCNVHYAPYSGNFTEHPKVTDADALERGLRACQKCKPRDLATETPAGGKPITDDGSGLLPVVDGAGITTPPAGPIPEDPTGVHLAVPEDAYHRHPTSLSQSGAKLILQAPALFDYHRRNPIVKRVFDFGSAAHKMVLGDGPDIVVIRREITDRKGNLVEVVDAPDLRSDSAKAHQAEIRAAGGIPVLRKEYQQIKAMADRLATHKRAMELLSAGQPEVSAWCVDEYTGVMRRGRADYVAPDVIVDYKSAESADPWAFARKAVDYGYDVQAAWYLDLFEDLGVDVDAFAFVVQMKDPPYLVSVVELDDDSIEHGRRRYQRALEIFRSCTETGYWPSYVPEDTHRTVRIPDHHLRREGLIA